MKTEVFKIQVFILISLLIDVINPEIPYLVHQVDILTTGEF